MSKTTSSWPTAIKQDHGENLTNVESANSLLTSELRDFLANTDYQGPFLLTARTSDSVDQMGTQSLI